jgi:hypothetical protein
MKHGRQKLFTVLRQCGQIEVTPCSKKKNKKNKKNNKKMKMVVVVVTMMMMRC